MNSSQFGRKLVICELIPHSKSVWYGPGNSVTTRAGRSFVAPPVKVGSRISTTSPGLMVAPASAHRLRSTRAQQGRTPLQIGQARRCAIRSDPAASAGNGRNRAVLPDDDL